MSTGIRVALVTAPNAEEAQRIGRALVEEELAACVNVVPGVTSIFRWEGAVQEDSEVLLFVKTRVEVVSELRNRIAELHPYDVPEVIELDVSGGLPAYLRWVVDETGGV